MDKIRVLPDIHIDLFQSVFKGREDIFAIHWEKGNKSGYMPAYQYDPHMYRLLFSSLGHPGNPKVFVPPVVVPVSI